MSREEEKIKEGEEEKQEVVEEKKLVEEEQNTKKNVEVDVVEPIEEEEEKEKEKKPVLKTSFDKESWQPRTALGKRVKAGEIKDINEILDNGIHFMEAEIVDALVSNLEVDLLLIGQSKGKFGGGQRRVFRQTQKKTPEGNKPKFATYAVIGNKDGYVGIGYGKAKETVPAREKSFRSAKLNIIKIRRGCGSWECNCKTPHSIPFAVEGKVGSSYIKLMPAPKGAGLVAEKECAHILEMAGVKDVYSLTLGQSRTKINLINACMNALKMLMRTKVDPKYFEQLGVVEGAAEKGVESG